MDENLVLLCGWARNEKSYEKLFKSAPPNWKIFPISYEQLMPNGKINEFRENILIILQEKNLNQFNLMGHSLGGALAIKFTSSYPKMVKSLFLVDSEGIYSKERVLQSIGNFFRSHASYGHKKTLENFKAFYRIVNKPILHWKLANLAHHLDLQKEAKRIKTPTIILWGENDHLTPLWQGKKLHKLIPNSKLIILKNLDHDWILHSPEKFWEITSALMI